MNKNSRRIAMAARKANKKGEDYIVEVPGMKYHDNMNGSWQKRHIPTTKYAHKKKSKPFPTPNGDPLTMLEQKEIFYGKGNFK